MRRSHLDHTKSSNWTVLIKFVAGLVALVSGMAIAVAFTSRPTCSVNPSLCDQSLASLTQTLESYQNIGGVYPSEAQGLEALISEPTDEPLPRRWTQTFESDRALFDPWGTKIQYFYPGQQNPEFPELVSAGPDKTFGTEDDLSSQDGL